MVIYGEGRLLDWNVPKVIHRIPYSLHDDFLFLTVKSEDLFKYTSQLSSQSFLIEIRETLFKFGRIMAVDARVDNCDDNGMTPDFVDDMSSPFRRRTDGLELS